MRYCALLVLVAVAAVAAGQVNALNRRMLGSEPQAAVSDVVPQGGNSGPDSWEYWGGGGGGKIWQNPGFGGGGGRGRDKWGNGMLSQGAATTTSTAAAPTETVQAAQPAGQAAPVQTVTVAAVPNAAGP